MKKLNYRLLLITFFSIMLVLIINSCKKSEMQPIPLDPNFNLDVVLKGSRGSGFINFRQDSDTGKIISLNTGVRDLLPNHEYKLQRAVDTTIDGNCAGTAWLTLGKGLTPQSIFTDGTGSGTYPLWRSVAALPTGARYDIHFQVIDAVTMAVVLSGGCYKYTVR